MSEKIPLYTTIEGLGIFEKLLKDTIESITTFENPRLIIIQAWITIDFCIRETLINGLNLGKFITKDFDLRYILLPQRFDSCIELLKKLEKSQRRLNKRIPDHRIPHSLSFLTYLKKNNIEFFNTLLQLEQDYYRAHHPECLKQKGRLYWPNPKTDIRTGAEIKYREVEDEWIKVAAGIDDDWIKKAKKLNKLRNNAAHVYSEDFIYKELGINGRNKISQLKSFCKTLLKHLLDVTIK